MKNFKPKQLAIMGLFIALSVIGAQLKIAGSIAFDSFPAFLAACILSPIAGLIVAIIGHLVSALTSGFPFSLPIHIEIAVMMGLTAYIVGILAKKVHLIVAMIVGVILNGPVSLIVIAYTMEFLQLGSLNILALMPILTIAAGINLLITALLVPLLKFAKVDVYA